MHRQGLYGEIMSPFNLLNYNAILLQVENKWSYFRNRWFYSTIRPFYPPYISPYSTSKKSQRGISLAEKYKKIKNV